MDVQKLYQVSYVAKSADVSESLVRMLDRRGIVVPVRDASGRRLYSEADIEAIKARKARIRQRRQQ